MEFLRECEATDEVWPVRAATAFAHQDYSALHMSDPKPPATLFFYLQNFTRDNHTAAKEYFEKLRKG